MPEERIDKENREKEVTDPLYELLKGLEEEEPIREEVKDLIEEVVVVEEKEKEEVKVEEAPKERIPKRLILILVGSFAFAFLFFFTATYIKAKKYIDASIKHAEAGDIEKAREFYKKACATGFKRTKAACIFASSCIKMRRYDEALNVLHQIRKKEGADKEVEDLLVRLYRIRKEKILLHSLCEDILKREPLSATAIAGLGWIKFWEGNIDGAKEMVQAALGEEPKNIEALSLLQNIYLQTKQYGKAVSVHRSIYKFTKGKYCEASSLIALADIFLEKGKEKLSEELLEHARRQDPLNPAVYHRLATLHIKRGADDEAIKFINISKELDPSFVPAHTLYAHILYKKGRIDEAIKTLDEAIKLSPNLAQPYKELADIYYYDLNDMKKACALYREAQKLGAEDDELFYNLGVAFYKEGNFQEAIGVWERLIEKHKKPNLYFGLANAYALLGELKKASYFYEQAIDGYKKMVLEAMKAASPEKEKYAYALLAKAYNNLATLFEKERNLQKASTLYTKALQCSSIAKEENPFSYLNIERLCLRGKEEAKFYNEVQKWIE